MSNEHPIPKALRDRFDQIEDAICRNRMERGAVFTQMRTAVQAYFMSAEPEEGDHDGRQLEWERCENKRLRAELGECKGEYDRAVNKVDALRDQLDAMCRLWPDDMSDDGSGRLGWQQHVVQTVIKARATLSASAAPAKGSEA